MTVVRSFVSGVAEQMSVNARQDRDSAKQGQGSGFSETLGAIDKGASSAQASTSRDTGSAQQTSDRGPVEADARSEAPAEISDEAVKDDTLVPAVKSEEQSGKKPLLADLDLIIKGDLADGKHAEAKPLPLPDNGNASVLGDNLTDLAKLVEALTKTGATTSAASKVLDASSTKTDDEAPSTEGDAGSAMLQTGNGDVLAMLAATAVSSLQPAQNDAAKQQPVTGSLTENMPGLDGALAGDPDEGPAVTTVRLQKQDVPAVDLHIATNEDGSMNVDVSAASGKAADMVQIVETRRFIGLAPTSNAAAITTAMAADPDWATTLAGQTAGRPLIASTGEVVHTLKIQMNPVELGHVTAALKLVGDELSVHLTAHTLKGYAELQKDSSSILDALKSQGFSVEQVTVNMASASDRQDGGAGNRQASDQGQQNAQFNGQRRNEDRPQEQFYRQPSSGSNEDMTAHEGTGNQPATAARSSTVRSGQLYL